MKGNQSFQPPEIDEDKLLKKQLESVKNSLNHKQIHSIDSKNSSKIFTYHYAEQKRWHLGGGSYGEVYICFFQQISTKKVYKFALKQITIPSEIHEVKKIEETVATTRQQINSLIKLRQNKNIIKIEDVVADKQNKVINIVLQFCNNKDLESFVRQQRAKGRMKTQEQILFYFNQLLNAFRDLYKYNIIHRDIKPANIFVHEKVLKIGDFGLSQQLFTKKQNLQQNHMIGTLVTSAPQLIRKQPYTNKCDIYSLGQKFAFSDIDLFDRKVFNQNISLSFNLENSKSIIKCSPELHALLKKMLAFQEKHRIQWSQLFQHVLFKRSFNIQESRPIRVTIGRNILGDVMQKLQNTLPTEFYKYINQEQQMDLTNVLDQGESGATQSLATVVKQIINFNFKIMFLKMLLNQIHLIGYSQKQKKNKVYFFVIKDLLRLGIDKQISNNIVILTIQTNYL